MKLLPFLVITLLIGSAFAISDSAKQCVKSCCENSGGTYLPDSNGCDHPGNGSDTCSIACIQNEPKQTTCIGAIIPLILLGCAIAERK